MIAVVGVLGADVCVDAGLAPDGWVAGAVAGGAAPPVAHKAADIIKTEKRAGLRKGVLQSLRENDVCKNDRDFGRELGRTGEEGEGDARLFWVRVPLKIRVLRECHAHLKFVLSLPAELLNA
ncbi:MAG TPA: hypothetical protein VFC78_14925 [Tepidisphaeraceae bacterium]|nr:hypothetical protein [Tepidisphaeraceae bacterium]